MVSKETELCFLTNFDSIEEALKITLGISGSQIKKQHFSKEFLKSRVSKEKSFKLPLNLINRGIINPKYLGPEVEILFEDESLIAINKPPEIHCHPLTYLEQDNCLSFLRENLFFKKSEFAHERNFDPGLLYRLDLGTSGVLFLVKSKKDYEEIRKNFLSHAKIKTYLAIISGEFNQEGEYRHFFKAFGEKGNKIMVADIPFAGDSLGEGKIEIKKLGYKEGLTLVSVELGAGIRHQIRAQLAHLGYPILGDTLYGGEDSERLFLHAYHYKISFADKVFEVIAKNAPLFGRFFDLDGIF
ncbi:MAG: RNA pseudouridine synthase [Deltaproteobacteria bacterium]|nr:MAG: RNA pseudouridine synthase [Deltaproteobacteria bacterium]